jgi:hypothetical protein
MIQYVEGIERAPQAFEPFLRFLDSTKSRETLTSHSLEVRPPYLDHRIIDWLRGSLHFTMHSGPGE